MFNSSEILSGGVNFFLDSVAICHGVTIPCNVVARGQRCDVGNKSSVKWMATDAYSSILASIPLVLCSIVA